MIGGNDINGYGNYIGKILKSDIQILNVNRCNLDNSDISNILILTYSLKCVKLQCLIVGNNNFNEGIKNSLIYFGMLNAPNAYIDVSNNHPSASISSVMRKMKERLNCEVLTHSKNYKHIKAKEFLHFHGKDSLFEAIAFRYIELLKEKDATKMSSVKVLYDR